MDTEELYAVGTTETTESVISVPADESVNNQLSDITLCLVVIICLIGVAIGVSLGSIMWGRFRK